MSKNHDKVNNPEEVRNDDIEINDVEATPEEVDAEAAKEMVQEELTKEEALANFYTYVNDKYPAIVTP